MLSTPVRHAHALHGALYGDVASVLGLVVGVVGLVFSILAWWNARSARQLAQAAVDGMSRQVLTSDVSRAIRYVHEAADAGGSCRWDRAIDRCREARLVMLPLAYDLRIREDERVGIRGTADSLRLVMQYIEQKRIPAGLAAQPLGSYHTRFFDEAVAMLAQLEGRLRSEVAEVE